MNVRQHFAKTAQAKRRKSALRALPLPYGARVRELRVHAIVPQRDEEEQR